MAGANDERGSPYLVAVVSLSFVSALCCLSDTIAHETAKWEIRSNVLVANAAVKTVERALAQRDALSLAERRAKLAALLTSEDESLRMEFAALAESPADRAQRLVKEARRLKTEREEKRAAFADAARERQWADGCDDLRTIDSNFFKQHCSAEVQKQIEEKQGRKARSAEEQARWAAEWERERQRRGAEEDAKLAARAQALLDNRRDLRSQMQDQEHRRAADRARESEDKAVFNKILEMDARAAAERAAQEQDAKRALQRDTVAFNERIQAEREAAYLAQREADKADLAQKMAEYRSDTLRVENDKARQQKDIIEFRAYLRQRKEEEARQERDMERLVQEDLERANLARDVQWERERLARDRLMKGVYEARSAQLDEKARRREREEEELYMEKRAAEIEFARAQEAELAELAAERQAAQRRLRDLDSQVAINRERKRLAQEAARAELRAAEEAERAYKAKLDQFRANTVEQSKRNYGIKPASDVHPTGDIRTMARP